MVFSKSQAALLALYLLASSHQALGRTRWFERDNRPIFLHPRRFNQQNPEVLTRLSQACKGEVCGTLSGEAVSPLLAAADECAQQDMADKIIDAAQQFDEATKANMIALAVEYRQAERNVPPDFNQTPPLGRNSLFCQKAPKNSELDGLVQAQDPANDPDLFFDPQTSTTIKRGDRADTFPFGTSGSTPDVPAQPNASTDDATATTSSTSAAETSPCENVVTVTVTVSPTDDAAATESATATSSSASVTATPNAGAIGDFGKCTVPEIIFAAGLDGRRETAFEPADKTSFNHGSAQAIGIIAQAICDTLTNSCGADQTAKDTCARAQAAANGGASKTGEQADLFNAEFGITTNFADVVALDDKGEAIPGTGSQAAQDAVNNGSGGIGDFGTCTVPQIKFAARLDGRKETAFEPVDKTSFNHDSAQNIDIITQAICDTLTNSCGADATAKATCKRAQAASKTGTPKTGEQADLFNAEFGITTDFASVPVVDNQGNVVSGPATPNASVSSSATVAPSSSAAVTSTSASAATSTTAAAAPSGENLQKFAGALGGVVAPAVSQLANGQFQVDGNAAFQQLRNALQRSCDVQNNKCANAANASGNKGDLTVAACNQQQNECGKFIASQSR